MTEVARVTGGVDGVAVVVRFKNGHTMIGKVPRRLSEFSVDGEVLVVVALVDMSKGVIQLTKQI